MTYERTLETRVEQRYFVSALGHERVTLSIDHGSALRFGTKQELDEFIKLLQHAWTRSEQIGAKR